MRNSDIEKVFAVWKAKNEIFEPVNKKLALDIVDQIASLFSPGNFYYYVINFATYEMDFVSDGTKTVLGIHPKDFTLNKVLSLYHPEDIADLHRKERASVNFKLEKIALEDITKYKTVYIIRMVLDDGSVKTILHQAKAISISNDGKLQQVMGVHTDVTNLNFPIDHKISFIGHKKPNYYYNEATDAFDLLEDVKNVFTKREKEILNEIAKGNTSGKIASILNVSEHTINTHKRNILKKTKCKNIAELITKCIREGII